MSKNKTTPSPKVLLIGAVVGGILTILPAAHAQLANDPFLTGAGGYDTGSTLQGQNPTILGFNGAWGLSGATVQGTSLNYSSAYYAAPTGGSILTTGGRVGRALDSTAVAALASTANYTVYLSVLLNFAGGSSAWGYSAFEMYDTNPDVRSLTIGLGAGAGGISVNAGGTAQSLGAADSNTHLFLAEFNLSSTPNSDSLTVWMDPTLGGTGDPSGGLQFTGLELANITSLGFGSGNSGNAFDEIRMGTTLADVGIAPVPEPATLSLLGLGAIGILVARRKRA